MTAEAHVRPCLATLYRRNAEWLRHHLVRRGVTAENAEDAVQETFVIALSTLGELRDPRATRSYLATTALRIAWRTASQHAETATGLESLTGADTAGGPDRRGDAEDLLAHVAAVAGRSVAALVANLATGRTTHELKLSPAAVRRARARAASALTGTEWARRRTLSISVVPNRATPEVRAQIERLPFRQREVLTRHIYSGMTPAQIAWHLNISANSARVSLHSARTALGRQLGVDGDDLTALLRSCPRTGVSPDSTVLPGPWHAGRTAAPPHRSAGTSEVPAPGSRTA